MDENVSASRHEDEFLQLHSSGTARCTSVKLGPNLACPIVPSRAGLKRPRFSWVLVRSRVKALPKARSRSKQVSVQLDLGAGLSLAQDLFGTR